VLFQMEPFLVLFGSSGVPPWVGFAMLRTDLDTPLLTSPSYAARPVSHFVRLTCSGILIISCTVFGFSQCYAQDVADAARQEQARKQNQQKKPKHVYTDEDLKRAQILTPEDRAEVEARKLQQPLPGAENAQPLDAQAVTADEPLGDVARRYPQTKGVTQTSGIRTVPSSVYRRDRACLSQTLGTCRNQASGARFA